MNNIRGLLPQYLEKAMTEQLSAEYERKGYEISIEPVRGDFRYDLMARKGDEILLFEIKAKKWTRKDILTIRNKRNYAVHNLGANFRIIFVQELKDPDIYIEGLEVLLEDLLTKKYYDQLDRLATHFSVDTINDLQYESLNIDKNSMEIQGTGVLEISLQFGSDKDVKEDEGLLTSDAFSFSFHILVDFNLNLLEERLLEADI